MDYDCIIIGAGLSGLSAAIRLAHFGMRVRLFERHTLPGGMNSYYPRRDGIAGLFDTGLHALTNFVPETAKGAPLNGILRQLRLRRDELALCPQRSSLIAMPQAELVLRNDFQDLQAQIAEKFPWAADGFSDFIYQINKEAYSGEIRPWRSALAVLREYIASPVLIDLLRMPVMYYGCPTADDMDFQSFATMFKSVIMEGFARPQAGMKPFIQTLLRKAESEGAAISFGRAIRQIEVRDGTVVSVTDDQGESHTARHYLTTIGAAETGKILQGDSRNDTPLCQARPGNLGFVEGIFQLPKKPSELGFSHCIAFLNFTNHFEFHPMPAEDMPSSVLMCAPGNYIGCEEDSTLRISTLTDASFWLNPSLPRESYTAAKNRLAQRLLQAISGRYPGIAAVAKPADLFTPKTIRRFTGHCNGAIYGSPDKLRNFRTGIDNLLIAGTDQGLLGIVGSMLSGIISANAMMT